MIRLAVGLLLIVLPVAELAVLIKTGQLIGVWTTVAFVIGMALVGMLILSQQSYTVFRRTLEAMSEGRPPVGPVLDGLFLMLAGTLLLMPGLISDVVALVLLVPPIRRIIAAWSMRRILQSPHVRVSGDDADWQPEQRPPRAPGEAGSGPVIEGEFERLDESAPRRRRDDQRP